MNRMHKSATLCHQVCHTNIMLALFNTLFLYGSIGMCAFCVTYLLKLFNNHIGAQADDKASEMEAENCLLKLRKYTWHMAQVAQKP